MATIRIAGIQMEVSDHVGDNEAKIIKFIEQTDADYLVFPEMALTGYHPDFASQSAIRAWDKIATACRQNYTTVILGTGALIDDVPYIQIRIIGNDGSLIGTHEKLIPTVDDRRFCRPGEELRTFSAQGVQFGCLSGNEFWMAPGFGSYPDRRLSCQLGEHGAQIIFHCIHSGADPSYEAYYDSNLKLRARESGSYVVTANAASNGSPINAKSGVVSPEGEWLVSAATTGEQVYHYDIELD